MVNKKLIVGALTTVLLLSGCGNLNSTPKSPAEKRAEKNAVMTTGRLDGDNYQAILEDGTYKTSPVRGLSLNLLNSHENSANLDKGLLDLSKEEFDVDRYLFQEGQFLTREDILNAVERKSEENPKGLNSKDDKKPYIFQQVIEQDYLDKKTKKLKGISLGIALNKVDYSGEEPVEIDDEDIEKAGKEAAEKLLEKMRDIKEVGDVPIKIGLFKQATQYNVAGGSYFASAVSEKGAELSDWKEVDEEHVVLGVSSKDGNAATKDGFDAKFQEFKSNLEDFFPNNSGVSGVAHYRDGVLSKAVIKIETKYFNETEILNYTQYVAQMTGSVFNVPGTVEVQINSIEGPQGFVKKEVGSKEVFAHVFN